MYEPNCPESTTMTCAIADIATNLLQIEKKFSLFAALGMEYYELGNDFKRIFTQAQYNTLYKAHLNLGAPLKGTAFARYYIWRDICIESQIGRTFPNA